jgi:hypothetical protein
MRYEITLNVGITGMYGILRGELTIELAADSLDDATQRARTSLREALELPDNTAELATIHTRALPPLARLMGEPVTRHEDV